MNEPAAGAILIGLERTLRHAPDLTAFRFTVVSDLRRLVAYRQAVLMERTGTAKLKVAAVSNVASLDRNAPYIVFMERLMVQMARADRLGAPAILRAADIEAADQQDWHEFLPAEIYWQPMKAPDSQDMGGLILVRPEAWTQGEMLLLDEVADAAAHAWAALAKSRLPNRLKRPGLTRRTGTAIAAALLILLFFPVRLSVIAPAEVVPRDPTVIAAPINAVIREIHVKPNAAVMAGDILFSFENAELTANHAIAERAVEEAEAELKRASQQAFGDAKGRAEMSLRQARLALRQEQAAYSKYQLSQVNVRAPADGIVIFGDANQWRGRPVSTGERVMALATPTNAELAILIPVSDAISLEPGATVRLFLDVAPLSAVSATLERASYQPQQTPGGTLAYRAVARFGEGEVQPRIGLKGSAKVMGENVPLALFLFRRPLSALRQLIGF